MGKFVAQKSEKKVKTKDIKGKKVKKLKKVENLEPAEEKIKDVVEEVSSKSKKRKNDASGEVESVPAIEKKVKKKNKNQEEINNSGEKKEVESAARKEKKDKKSKPEVEKVAADPEDEDESSDDFDDDLSSLKKDGPAYDPAQASRTIFVGNLPINTKKSHVKKYFGTFGEIQTVRFRTFHGQKIQSIRQLKNHPSISAYVVFDKDEAAIGAQEMSGKLFRDAHLRVMMADGKKKYYDGKRTVFVGNLTYATTDDDLFEVFQSCGEIQYVRTLRSHLGCKGTAYVCFKNPEAVGLAMELNQTMMHDRPIRVERYKAKPKTPKGAPEGKKSGQGGKLQKGGGKKGFQKKTGKPGKDIKAKTDVKRLQKGPKPFNRNQKPEKPGQKSAGKATENGTPVKNKTKKNKKHRSTANMKLAKKLNPQLKKTTKKEK
ncbi:uncharacterized protein DMENIID0001_088790 [Sergentomyia squamirostris]